MKKIIRFSRAFIPANIVSLVLIIAGGVGYFIHGGFNLGVDFQAGLMQEIRFAPTAFSISYTGKGIASVSMSERQLDIVVSGSDIEKATHSFPYQRYPSIGALVEAIDQLDGFSVTEPAEADAQTNWLLLNAQQNPRLSSLPYNIHYLKPDLPPIGIEVVRSALASIGRVSVQSLGVASERKYLIRVQDSSNIAGFAQIATEQVAAALEAEFGEGEIAVSRSDYVGARFSENLTNQVGFLLVLTLLLILVYSAIRFEFKYAVGAVLAIIHDGLIMVAFIVWTRMEFNTSTIAAIMTILGYSINDTIVIFDRVRETIRLYPDDEFPLIIDRAITETLSRTIITTITTMFAVLSLFLFTTGNMKDFALALLVGLVSGVYSTIFAANGFVVFWQKRSAAKPPKKPKTKSVIASAKG